MADLDTRVALLEERVHNVIIRFGGLDQFFSSIKSASNLEQRVALLEAEVQVLEGRVSEKVEKNEFNPVKILTYGFTGIILTTVIFAILYTIGLKFK